MLFHPTNSATPNATFSTFNYTEQKSPPWILNIPDSQRISLTICYALILVLSVVGNTSIIAIVARNPSMRTTINYLIANMAATDLASSLAVTARFFSVMHNLSKAFGVTGVLGNIFCKLGPYIQDVSISVSFHSMVAIAFDRFFAVVYPMRATPRLLDIRILLPGLWLPSLGIFSVYFATYKLVNIQGYHLCYPKWPGLDKRKSDMIFYLIILHVFWLLPLTIITVLYTKIALRMRRHTIPGQQMSVAEEIRRKQNHSVVKMAVAIVFCFFICWFPYHILVIVELFVWRGVIPTSVQSYHILLLQTLSLVYSISFVTNPYICFGFSSNFRKCFRSLFPFSVLFPTRIRPLGVSSQIISTNGLRLPVVVNSNSTSRSNFNREKTSTTQPT